jgi:hypothetical protein
VRHAYSWVGIKYALKANGSKASNSFGHWNRWLLPVVLVGALAGAGGSMTPAHAGVRVRSSQTLPASQGGCSERYGWDADSGTHSITIRYSIDCAGPTPAILDIELDENGTPAVHVSNEVLTAHTWLQALASPITHDERSVTYPFAKPGRAYTVKAVFAMEQEAVPPPNCQIGDGGFEACTYVTAITVPFTQDVVEDAPVAAPWSWTGTAELDGGRTCTISAGADVTPDGGLTVLGSTSCPTPFVSGTTYVYADRRELSLLSVGSSTSTWGGSTSQAQVPVVVPGATYTVVYVTDVNTEDYYGSDTFLSAPPGCVLHGRHGVSNIHCEIAANVTV